MVHRLTQRRVPLTVQVPTVFNKATQTEILSPGCTIEYDLANKSMYFYEFGIIVHNIFSYIHPAIAEHISSFLYTVLSIRLLYIFTHTIFSTENDRCYTLQASSCKFTWLERCGMYTYKIL